MYNIHVAFAIVSVCANMAWRGNSDQTSQKQSASHMSRICAAKSLYTVDAEIVYTRNGQTITHHISLVFQKMEHHVNPVLLSLFLGYVLSPTNNVNIC